MGIDREAARDIPSIDPDLLIAAMEMIGRTGAEGIQVRYSDDPEPVVWMAIAGFKDGHYSCSAGITPLQAILKLCDELIDGGICRHCHKPTGVLIDHNAGNMPKVICWYTYDPELKTFRRGCEGEAA